MINMAGNTDGKKLKQVTNFLKDYSGSTSSSSTHLYRIIFWVTCKSRKWSIESILIYYTVSNMLPSVPKVFSTELIVPITQPFVIFEQAKNMIGQR